MSKDEAIAVLGFSVAVPAAIAVAIIYLCRYGLRESVSQRYAAAAALAIAYFAGSMLTSGEWVPTRHGHWLPYLGLVAAVIGPVALAGGVTCVERWLLFLLLAFVSAWLLVPTWSSLDPPRSVHIPSLGGYLFLLMALMDPLPSRLPVPRFIMFLLVAALTVAAMIALSVSLIYGKVAGIAVASLAGVLIASCYRRDAIEIRGMLPAFCILVGGWAFVGCIEPRQPLYALLVLPAAPLALWICLYGPLSRLTGLRGAMVQVAAVLIPVAAAVTVLVVR